MSSAPLLQAFSPLDLQAPEPAVRPKPEAAANKNHRRQGCVLYIEDNAVNTLVVEELLSRRPALLFSCAVDGRSGLQQAQANQPDLILLDMQLPDGDGYEVLRRLRAHPCTAHIPCIALSANAMEDERHRALTAGFLAYWTKPIDFKAFLDGMDAFFTSRL